MANNSFKIKKSINIEPLASPTLNAEGDIGMNSTSHKLEVRDNSATRSVVTEDGTATLTNKTFDADGTGNSITNIENADIKAAAAIALNKLAATTASRALVSDASGFVSAATTTSTEIGYVNGVTSAIQTQIDGKISASSSDTLTNKTIDADANTITNIENADIKAAAAIALDKLAATTASRALVSDASGFVSAATTTATEIGYVNGVTSAIQTQLDGKIAKTLTTTTGDMIYASSANTPARLPIGSAGQVLKTVGGIPAWAAASSGGINYISSNPDAEADTTGWATYADAAGTSPVDGTGGSPNITWTRTTSSPLRGSGSFLFTKDAANRQGQGASYDFTIDSSDKAKVLTINFDYIVGSGTFSAGSSSADSDLTVWIYDVTNSRLIQPSTIKLFSNSSTIADKYSAQFQTSSDSTSYRLIFHVTSTSASAYTLKFDNFSVGPSSYIFGTPVTDSKSYSPAGSWENTTYSGQYWRVGDKFNAQINLTFSSAPTTSDFSMTPAQLFNGLGITLDTAKLGSGVISIGTWAARDLGTAEYSGSLYLYAGTTIYMGDIDGNGNVTKTNPFTIASGDFYDLQIHNLPILGWSSSVQMSDSADTRVVAAGYSTLSSTSYTSPNAIVHTTKLYDTHNAYNTSTGEYTAPVPGIYKITIGRTYTGSGTINYGIYKNGSISLTAVIQAGSVARVNGSASIQVNAGDKLTVVGDTSVTFGDTGGYIFFERLSGPSAIAATETIAAKYTAINTTTFTTSGVVADFATKVFDTHGAVTTGASWKFTAPAYGIYHISLGFYPSSTVGLIINLQKNGSAVERLAEIAASSTAKEISASTEILLNAGDYIDLKGFAGSTTLTFFNDSTLNRISIFRI